MRLLHTGLNLELSGAVTGLTTDLWQTLHAAHFSGGRGCIRGATRISSDPQLCTILGNCRVCSVPETAERYTSTPAVLAEVTARGCMGVRSSEAPVLCLDTSGQTALNSAAVAADITCRG